MKPTGPANTSPTAAGIQEIMGRGRRASREAEGACGKKARSGSPKHRSLSPNFWGKGKPPLAAMRNDHRFHCRGVAEPSGYDEEKYSGVVTVDIRGRFDPLNAIGTSVAKTFPSRDDGPTLMPGRVVGQKSLKGRSTGVKYRVIYLNGVEEELNEDALRRYSALFSNASMYNEAPLKPIIVRMM